MTTATRRASQPTEGLRYEAVADHVAALIGRGALRAGDRLPSVRALARQQRVSVTTVVESYKLLESRGLVEVRPQSGHYVRRRQVELPEPRAPRRAAAPCKVSVAELVSQVYRASGDRDVVQLGAAQIDPRLLPTDKLNRIMATLARGAGAAGVTYPPTAGVPALRRELARRAATWGLALAPDDFVVTVGGMEALALCLRAVTRAGDTIVVETPTFYGLLQLFESLGLRVCEVPAHPRTGPDLDQLERCLEAGPIAACLLTPNFNNPTGALMPDEHKQRLVDLCARHGVPLVEDDVYGDLAHDGQRPRPAAAFAREGGVMLCGSISKTIAPGYRIGWAVPGRWRDQVERLKFAQTVATPALTQMAVAELMASGGYDHHLRTLRRRVAENVRTYTEAVAEHFPPGTAVSRPQGGPMLWVELPPGGDSLALYQAALAQGIGIAPGLIFSARPRFPAAFRLNCGHLWSELTERSVRTLGRLAAAQLAG